VIISRGPKNFPQKWHFLAKKVENFFKNAIFFILGGGRVALKENFREGILFNYFFLILGGTVSVPQYLKTAQAVLVKLYLYHKKI
jgi:hypothetical protein